MLVSAVLFGVDLCCVGHKTTSVERVRLSEQRIMRRLRVIAKFVPLRSKLVIVCGGAMMFCGLQVRLDGWVCGHGTPVALMGGSLLWQVVELGPRKPVQVQRSKGCWTS